MSKTPVSSASGPGDVTHVGRDQPAETASQVRWQIFALACGASFLLYLHRYSWNLVGPKLQSDLSFSNTEVAFLFSLFYYTYSSGQIPSGMIIDRYGPHRLLTALIVAWSLAATAIAHTTQLTWLGLCRLVFGAAQAGCYPALSKVTQQWFPIGYRTSLQGWIATTFGRSGGAMSPIIIGTIMMGWWGMSWQTAVTCLGGIGLVYAILFWRIFRNTPQEHPDVNQAELALILGGAQATSGDPLAGSASSSHRSTTAGDKLPTVLSPRLVLRNRSMRFFVSQQFLDAGSDVAFVSLIGLYFLKARGLDIASTGWLASLPLWGGALGGIAGGWLNDRGIRALGSRRWARSLVGFLGKLLGCIMLLLVVKQNSPLGAGLCLMAAKFFSDWSQPTTWGTCTDLGGRFSATVFSIINTAGTLGGVVMPLVFGGLLDWFTRQSTIEGQIVATTDWGPLFYLLSGMYLASGLCWLLVDCTKQLEPQSSGS